MCIHCSSFLFLLYTSSSIVFFHLHSYICPPLAILLHSIFLLSFSFSFLSFSILSLLSNCTPFFLYVNFLSFIPFFFIPSWFSPFSILLLPSLLPYFLSTCALLSLTGFLPFILIYLNVFLFFHFFLSFPISFLFISSFPFPCPFCSFLIFHASFFYFSFLTSFLLSMFHPLTS